MWTRTHVHMPTSVPEYDFYCLCCNIKTWETCEACRNNELILMLNAVTVICKSSAVGVMNPPDISILHFWTRYTYILCFQPGFLAICHHSERRCLIIMYQKREVNFYIDTTSKKNQLKTSFHLSLFCVWCSGSGNRLLKDLGWDEGWAPSCIQGVFFNEKFPF